MGLFMKHSVERVTETTDKAAFNLRTVH